MPNCTKTCQLQEGRTGRLAVPADAIRKDVPKDVTVKLDKKGVAYFDPDSLMDCGITLVIINGTGVNQTLNLPAGAGGGKFVLVPGKPPYMGNVPPGYGTYGLVGSTKTLQVDP